VATLAELASLRTDLDEAVVSHLLRLTASWSLLADLCFSDMLLMTRVASDEARDGNFVVLGQIRPNNRSTILNEDLIGTTQRASVWPLVNLAYDGGTRVIGDMKLESVDEPVPLWGIPVRFAGQVVAVLVRIQGPLRGPASLYEQAYLSIFERLATMVSAGDFPFREDDVAGPGLPRVGDGIILIDGDARVEFATPNASNALHRLGIYASSEGRTLRELGVRARVVERALEYAIPSVEEIERGQDVAILFHCVPLVEKGESTGVLTLLRDVSDLRQLNRMVLNKEQAIREVHHRVKNNLQTISSLLRLQARRSEEAETIQALQEAERRVRSIAVVHEVLSREPGEEVDFNEIVGPLVTLVEDSVLALHPVEIVVNGDLGELATDVATPLAVAIAELLTNAVEHAFINFGGDHNEDVGIVTLNLRQEDGMAIADIRDNGRGLDENFSLEVPTSLGLSIVRDLVRNQLHGTIDMRNVNRLEGGGTHVRVVVPSRLS
jgi:two-component system, sensor histidine kinase PdtaS